MGKMEDHPLKGRAESVFYAGPAAGSKASNIRVGLFLELRDLGLFFLFSEREAQEENRTERQ
jgi:hypothetical protein